MADATTTPGTTPGKDTSEHRIEWLSTIISLAVVAIPAILEMLDKGSVAYVILACVLAVAVKLGSIGYGMSRARVKSAASIATAKARDPQ